MASPRWQKVVRDLLSHRIRTALVVLSIAIGIFAVGVVMGGRQVLIREFEVDFQSSVPPSAEFDTSDFDAQVPARVGERDDVRAAEGRRRLTVRYTLGETSSTASTAGWDTLRLWAIPEFGRGGVQRLVREDVSSWPPTDGEIVIEKSALRIKDFETGDVISVESPTGKRTTLRIVGFAHDINAVPAQFQGAVVGYISMGTLPSLGEPEQLNHLSLVLDPTLSRAAASRIAADVRDVDLTAAGVQTYRTSVPKPGSHFLGDIFKALSLLLLAMGLLSLALSGFLVVTTVSAILSQQVRQVGIMKAIGGRRLQIAGMYLALVGGYGLLAVSFALPLTLWIGQMFIEFAAGILNFRVVDYSPPGWVIALEVGVGMLVPVLAASGPVHQGTTLPVVSALNSGASTVRFGHGIVDRLLGLVRGLPRPVALSLRNTFTRKGRLALTLTTLILASAVVMAVLSVRSSMLQTVDDIGSWWNYDAQVFVGRPQPAEQLEREASKVDGVTATETWLEAQASLSRPDGSENEDIYALGVPQNTRFLTPRMVAGRWFAKGADDEVVVNTDVLKDEPYLGVGHRMRVTLRGTETDVRVVGIASGQLMGPVIFIDKGALDSITASNGGASRLLVQTDDHTTTGQETVARRLERSLDDAGLAISGSQTQGAQKETIASELGILVTFLVIMATLLASVGVIGLTGTMTINVLESTREIGVMRSIGASHRSIFGIYITEGVVIAVMAWGAGAVLSWPLSVWLVSALGTAMSLPLSYAFSWSGIGAWLLSVVIIAALASLLPAWRASQVSIRDAISYE
ncbi:MAG TPA: ABC transporter permease [Coriobacteriia bacterium]|nr:ABC transporter permease [Coriobacteriia bacterium]